MNTSFLGFKQLSFWFKLTLAFFIRFKWLILGSIILGIVFFLLFRNIAVLFKQESEIVGYVGRFHTDELPKEILGLVSQGLTIVDESGQAQPGLAESWTQSDNGKVWTFILKKDKKWQDGTPVTSESIRYEFEDATIERPDEYTIIFKLENSFAPFPFVVSKPVFKKGLLGTGDRLVTRVITNGSFIEQLTLEHERTRQIIRFYPTEDQLKVAYELGYIDKMVGLVEAAPFDGWSEVSEVTTNEEVGQYVAVFFNNQFDIFKNKSVRQALSYALDKSKFTGSRVISPIPSTSWSYNSQIKPYDFDMTRAQELLRDIPKSELDTKQLTLSTTPVLLKEAELVAEAWRVLGLTVSVQVVSNIPEDYQAFLATYNAPVDPDQYQLWHSTQKATNITNFQNARIDKLLEDGRLELDFEKRRKIYLDFQRFLLEEAPAAFLYRPVSYTITRK